jgi:predicted RNA-binding Zn-ribbon protein involved in translation (DUF1610 family)
MEKFFRLCSNSTCDFVIGEHDAVHYCPRCGSSLIDCCPHCGAVFRYKDQAYCTGCSKPLKGAQTADQA